VKKEEKNKKNNNNQPLVFTQDIAVQMEDSIQGLTASLPKACIPHELIQVAWNI